MFETFFFILSWLSKWRYLAYVSSPFFFPVFRYLFIQFYSRGIEPVTSTVISNATHTRVIFTKQC